MRWLMVGGVITSGILCLIYFLVGVISSRQVVPPLIGNDYRQQREAAAKERYDAAVAYGAANPEQFDAVLVHFQRLVSAFQDTPYAAKAAGQIELWQGRRRDFAAQLLKDAEQAAEGRRVSEVADAEPVLSILGRLIEHFRDTPSGEEASRQKAIWDEKLNEMAKASLDEVLASAGRNAADDNGILGRIQEVGRKFHGTPASENAWKEMAIIIGKRRAARGMGVGGMAWGESKDDSIPAEWRGRLGGESNKGALIVAAGGTAEVEQAVLKSLRHLKKSQRADGSWEEQFQGAMTGLALLAFLAHGETPSSAEFGVTVAKGLEFLRQAAEAGPIGQVPEYETPIVACALAEAYGLTGDPKWKPGLEKCVNWMLSKQTELGGWGYLRREHAMHGPSIIGYQAPAGIGIPDLPITGWHLQALSTAYLVGIQRPEIGPALDRAVVFVKRLYSPQLQEFGYDQPTGGWMRSGIGSLCLLLWEGAEDGELKDALSHVRESIFFSIGRPHDEVSHFSKSGKQGGDSVYAYFHLTQAMFLFDGPTGEYWKDWRQQFMDSLLRTQQPDGSFRSTEGLGVYADAFSTLMLTTPYRVLPRRSNGGVNPVER